MKEKNFPTPHSYKPQLPMFYIKMLTVYMVLFCFSVADFLNTVLNLYYIYKDTELKWKGREYGIKTTATFRDSFDLKDKAENYLA